MYGRKIYVTINAVTKLKFNMVYNNIEIGNLFIYFY